MSAEPEYQAKRSRSGCKCGGPCFYCARPLHGPHDHDHAPIPLRHGGRETVPSCKDCHSLKDRVLFWYWSPETMAAAHAGLASEGRNLLMLMAGATHDPDFDLTCGGRRAAPDIERCERCDAIRQVPQ